MPGIEAVIGYAVGTFQVLFVDWWRKVAAHRRHLRLIQAELRRMSTFQAKFDWKDGLPPEDELLPIPPQPTELLIRTIGETDFRLTDEHDDDNSQQSLMHLIDGCGVLKYYQTRVLEVADEAPKAVAEQKRRLLERGLAYANAYDQKIDEVLFLIDDALADLQRRLGIARVGPQLDRLVGGIPPSGRNPRPLELNDPRIAEWRRNRDVRG